MNRTFILQSAKTVWPPCDQTMNACKWGCTQIIIHFQHTFKEEQTGAGFFNVW